MAAPGGKGGCGIGAGQCTITQLDAFASWFSPTSPQVVSIDAIRSTFVMRPRGGGPAVITPLQTIVSVSIFSVVTGGGTSACFVIPDNEFVVSGDLQHATLKATLSNMCGGAMTPQLGALQAAPLSGSGGSGGGSGGGGLALPLTVNVTWTGPGLAFHSTSNSTQTCGGFTSSFHTQGSSSQANANGNSLGFGDGTSLVLGNTLGAAVDDFNSLITSNGFPGPQCVFS
jgi:hypothetical protein